MQLTKVYEDDDVLILNKPPGMVVNSAASVSGQTIQGEMAEYLEQHPRSNDWSVMVPADFNAEYGTPKEVFVQRQGMVHRLDKDTSGALMWAKNPGALVNLLAQFRNRVVEKTYTCLVHGTFKVREGVIDVPIGRASKDRMKFAAVVDGRVATTDYQVIEQFSELDLAAIRQWRTEQAAAKGEALVKLNQPQAKKVYQGFSLVKCFPKTGRTHQIRVHMAHLQHPLVGDTTYVGRKRAKLDPLWCPRQFLHASEIVFIHPRSGVEIKIEVKLSSDLVRVLDFLVS